MLKQADQETCIEGRSPCERVCQKYQVETALCAIKRINDKLRQAGEREELLPCQAFTDGKSQAGAAVFAGGAIEALEWLNWSAPHGTLNSNFPRLPSQKG